MMSTTSTEFTNEKSMCDVNSQVSIDKSTQVSIDKSIQVSIDKSTQILIDKSTQILIDKSTQISIDKSTQISIDKPIGRPNTFKVVPHTVFMTIGPSTCGKTTFCKEYLIPQLLEFFGSTMCGGTVRYLSSDDIRWEIIGSRYGKYDPEMMNISNLAFEQLFSRAACYMTWPSASEFIVIDTTGLNEDFRKRVTDLCREKNYSLVPILFDYKSYDEYFQYASDKLIVSRHIKAFRERVIPVVNREFRELKPFWIKNRDFPNVKIKIPEWESYAECFLPPSSKAIVIGNVNGCYEELLMLLKQFRLEFGEDGCTLNFNKENESAPTIILIGNPYRVDGTHNDKLERLIQKNNILCVYENGLPFISVKNRWIATAKFLNRQHLNKLKHQQNESFIYDPIFNEPLRIFGSHPSTKMERKDNFYLIDGGCVHGGSLIGIGFTANNQIFSKKQLALSAYIPKDLKLLFPSNREIEITSANDLSPYLQYRHNKIVHAAAPFLSGTMSPAPADYKSGNTSESFESLNQALFYYKQHGVSRVSLQPKYMGSRCTVVLNKESPSYAISRSGFSIRIPGIQELLDSLKEKYLIDNITTAIIDGELLPWIAMGRSLIDDTFRSVEVGLRKDVQLLKKYGFETQLSKLAQARNTTKLQLQKSNINKIGQGLYHTLVSYDSFVQDWMGVEALERGLDTYTEQLTLFSRETPLQFKPFALLKTVHTENGKIREHIYNEPAGINFKRVSDDINTVVSVDDMEAAHAFNRLITENKQMEGIVVKPDIGINSTAVPYMKVRNGKYLTLIYGPTYQEPKRLQALIKRKKVIDKQRLSRLEYDISQELLQIPISSLGPHNQRYCDLVATFLKTNEEEDKVDPRL
ncbi:3 phosphatase [uncultured virus]|nr:3 phosphatase [uncultured virus]